MKSLIVLWAIWAALATALLMLIANIAHASESPWKCVESGEICFNPESAICKDDVCSLPIATFTEGITLAFIHCKEWFFTIGYESKRQPILNGGPEHLFCMNKGL